jgi:L-amino acid N-acyltransferase YncA
LRLRIFQEDSYDEHKINKFYDCNVFPHDRRHRAWEVGMAHDPQTAPTILHDCEDRHLASVREIYAHHVLRSLATFETEPPPLEETRRRWQALREAGYPYLVAERGGEVVGYAYGSAYRPRPAYRYTTENSVYVRADCVREGIGRQLMTALIPACEARGFRQMIAVIGDSGNRASIGLHQSLGFSMVGVLRSAGYKFGQWVDVVLMQRPLGAGDDMPPMSRAA